MATAANVYNAIYSMKSADKIAPWADAHPSEFRIIVEVEKLERSYE